MAATARALTCSPTIPAQPAGASHAKNRQLWLCAYFPDLALESLALDLAQAVASLETSKGKLYVHSVSIPARALGIETGMTPAAAQALCPGLALQARDPIAEQQALEKLAQTALAFSSWVSLQPPQSLLLEIRSCLNLFGGSERLRETLREKLADLQHKPVIAITPSAAASQLLARLGLEHILEDRQALRALLGPLPLTALSLNSKLGQRLQNAGLDHLVDLWRLPRDGLARRYGMPLLRQLDELAGLAQPAMTRFRNPPQFSANREMPAELERLQHFFPAIEQLAAEFAHFLQTRDATALGLTLTLRHHTCPATLLALDFRAGSRDRDHWLRLLQEKLQCTPLPAPVIGIGLQSAAIVPFQPAMLSLFDCDDSGADHSWQTVLDQLHVRLGHQALQQAGIENDHRPERALSCQSTPASLSQQLPPRPLWLLQQPQALALQELQLLAEPERIESGWWDDAPIRRDYWQALDTQGRSLWVFQDLQSGSWYLHGLFG